MTAKVAIAVEKRNRSISNATYQYLADDIIVWSRNAQQFDNKRKSL
ncbi:hypothetical protein N836_08805 [Leptolyngbya sp. Heron Island J]|nr:hypothetical protein N836_08805 [Leptolyngbya sp. Heron Island J]